MNPPVVPGRYHFESEGWKYPPLLVDNWVGMSSAATSATAAHGKRPESSTRDEEPNSSAESARTKLASPTAKRNKPPQLPAPDAAGPAGPIQRSDGSLGFSQFWDDDAFQGEALDMLAAAEAQRGEVTALNDSRSDSSEVPTDVDETKISTAAAAAVAAAKAAAVSSAATAAAAATASRTAAAAGPLAGWPFRLRYALLQAGSVRDALLEALQPDDLAAVRTAYEFEEGGLRAVRKLVEASKRVGGLLAKALPRPLGSDDALPLPEKLCLFLELGLC